MGIFYGNSSTKGRYTTVDDNPGVFQMRLLDGRIYEDGFHSGDGLEVTNAQATDVTNLRSNLEFFINYGGTSSNASKGSSDLDFTYILYAQSSDNASVTSAYIYSGTYSGTNQNANSFDATKFKIVGLAEVVGVTSGDFTSGNFLSSKGDLA